MKKSILLLFIASLFCFTAKSQFSVGPKIGLNLNKFVYDYKDQSYEPDSKYKISFHVGAMAKYQVAKPFAVRMGLLLVNKGSAYNSFPDRGADTVIGTITITKGYVRDAIYNLEIPLDFVLLISTGDDSELLINAGPYFGIALGGKRKRDFEYSVNPPNPNLDNEPVNDSRKIKIINAVGDEELSDDYDYIRPYDYGLNFGLGYRLYSFEYNINFGLGLGNLTTDYSGSNPGYADYDRNDWKQKNQTISFGITYFFEL